MASASCQIQLVLFTSILFRLGDEGHLPFTTGAVTGHDDAMTPRLRR